MTPRGVHGTKPLPPVSSRPAFTGWNPSTSLSGEIASITRDSSIWPGGGSWASMWWTAGVAASAGAWGGEGELDQAAVHRGVLVEFGDEGEKVVFGESRRQVDLAGEHSGLVAGLPLVPHVHPGGRVISHQHRGETRPDSGSGGGRPCPGPGP